MRNVPLRFRSAAQRKRFGVMTLAGIGFGVGSMCLCVMNGWWMGVVPCALVGLYAMTIWDNIKPRPAHRYQHFKAMTNKPEVAALAHEILRDQGYINQRQIDHLNKLQRN